MMSTPRMITDVLFLHLWRFYLHCNRDDCGFIQRYAEQDMAMSQWFADGPEDLSCYRALSGKLTSSYTRTANYV